MAGQPDWRRGGRACLQDLEHTATRADPAGGTQGMGEHGWAGSPARTRFRPVRAVHWPSSAQEAYETGGLQGLSGRPGTVEPGPITAPTQQHRRPRAMRYAAPEWISLGAPLFLYYVERPSIITMTEELAIRHVDVAYLHLVAVAVCRLGKVPRECVQK